MAALTAALRELDERLDNFISARLEELETEYPIKVEINAKANAAGAVVFSGYVMCDGHYTCCILHGHFRAKIADDMPKYLYHSGKIKDFMTHYENTIVHVSHNATAITIASGQHSLVFNK